MNSQMEPTPASLAARILPLLDLTSLDEDDTPKRIDLLCAQARAGVAAVCLHARFVPQARAALAGTGVRVVTVANFPAGDDDPRRAADETTAAADAGADEVDVVLPYRAWLAGRRAEAQHLVSACKEACGERVLLKVILETGALGGVETIAAASRDVIAAGADFLKTSTGMLTPGATLPAAAAMLAAIRTAHEEQGRRVGFKAAGGIRDTQGAARYLALADAALGAAWASPATLRFGASSLLDDLLQHLRAEEDR